VVKFSNQSKMRWFLLSQLKFTSSTSIHQIAFDGCNFEVLYLLYPMLVFNIIYWITFSIQYSFCGKIFMSIQVVLNIWEQFKVQNPDIFLLQLTLATCFFFIWCLYLIKKLEKAAHTSLVCVAKILYQSKK